MATRTPRNISQTAIRSKPTTSNRWSKIPSSSLPVSFFFQRFLLYIKHSPDFFSMTVSTVFCQTHKTLKTRSALVGTCHPKWEPWLRSLGSPGALPLEKLLSRFRGECNRAVGFFIRPGFCVCGGPGWCSRGNTHMINFFPWRWSFWKEFGYSPCCRVFADFIWFDFLGNRSALALYILLFRVHSLYSSGIVGNIWAAGESVFTQNLPLELVSNPTEI